MDGIETWDVADANTNSFPASEATRLYSVFFQNCQYSIRMNDSITFVAARRSD